MPDPIKKPVSDKLPLMLNGSHEMKDLLGVMVLDTRGREHLAQDMTYTVSPMWQLNASTGEYHLIALNLSPVLGGRE